jgi:acyl transferase domain-containing protein
VPRDRWEPVDARAVHGVFLDHVDLSDANFFRISPREAAAIDPQQRLLLELGWEALEDAGMAADRMAGDRVGAYVGASSDDYAKLFQRYGEEIAEHTLTGLNKSIIANRLSYYGSGRS